MNFQATLIVAGFVTCGYYINQSVTDWLENPVQTTLDSIAAPIEDIQFPTVTVCQDESQGKIYKRAS